MPPGSRQWLSWTGPLMRGRLVFTNVVSEPGTAGPAAAEWEAGLEVVVAQLDGVPIDWSPFERAEALASRYR